MRNGGRQDSRHPMQPLCPKRQPWSIQVTSRPMAMAHSPQQSSSPFQSLPTVEQEILLRQRIEERVALKLEKRHDAVSVERQARRLQRQKFTDNPGKIVKALQEREYKRSASFGSSC
ncbi:hypothetical protein KP509_11G045100 [Ceratopteris richardii]|uniref:Uncharacterized protein n=1 Tax=Ceratopteris richardii TaxID=49495 RepID=A0A8T2TU43_CERRI|nr:hypothetical protein KP509_11G045100 [Ceratopteris richardii]